MNEKERSRLIRKVRKATDEAAELTGMAGQYQLEYVFSDWFDDCDEASGTELPSVYSTTAVTVAQWQYKRARITWYLPMCATRSDRQLLVIAVHELVHVLLNPIDSLLHQYMPPSLDEEGVLDPDDEGWWSPNNEFATESVTRALLHAAGIPFDDDEDN